MKITICSDIHDKIWKLADARPGMNDGDVLIACGDFCAPFTLRQLAEGFQGPVHAILGNNDGDPLLLSKVAKATGNTTLHGAFARLELGGYQVAVNHYPEIAEGLAASGIYDLVCYGHDHTLRYERIGKTMIVNPGELMGRFGRSTYAIVDTETGVVTVREVQTAPAG
ncbi:MAG: YfcE family phosphodiesterase [Anaerolineales bacterium]|nr:YfcE family phosphodiesterase [Anaerolineales bacterium]